jgi:hypothetical protein
MLEEVMLFDRALSAEEVEKPGAVNWPSMAERHERS